MKLRKLFVVLLALLVVLGLVGCGSGGGSYDDPVSTPNYLCFTSTGNSSIKMEVRDGTPDSFPDLKYSKDGTTWEDFIVEDTIVELADGEKVYLRGDNTPFAVDHGFLNFVMTGSIAASGNIMSLVDKTCESVTIPKDNCFSGLFYQCTALTAAPELPATTLTDGCYYLMFYGCTNLTAAPKLPATTLAEDCYSEMFSECTALTSAPELPAKSLSDYCYYRMFDGCTALTAAPELPATTLVSGCYYSMFSECSKLSSIKVHFTDWNSGDGSTDSWVWGVADKGTFTCPSALPHSDFNSDKVPKDSGNHWDVTTF